MRKLRGSSCRYPCCIVYVTCHVLYEGKSFIVIFTKHIIFFIGLIPWRLVFIQGSIIIVLIIQELVFWGCADVLSWVILIFWCVLPVRAIFLVDKQTSALLSCCHLGQFFLALVGVVSCLPSSKTCYFTFLIRFFVLFPLSRLQRQYCHWTNIYCCFICRHNDFSTLIVHDMPLRQFWGKDLFFIGCYFSCLWSISHICICQSWVYIE